MYTSPKNPLSVKRGERVRECRKEKKLSQAELARQLETLIDNGPVQRSADPHAISRIETGGGLSREYALLIGQALGVRPEYLLCDDDYKTEVEKVSARSQKIGDIHRNSADALRLYLEAMGMTLETGTAFSDEQDYLIKDGQGKTLRALDFNGVMVLSRDIYEYAQFKILKSIGRI